MANDNRPGRDIFSEDIIQEQINVPASMDIGGADMLLPEPLPPVREQMGESFPYRDYAGISFPMEELRRYKEGWNEGNPFLDTTPRVNIVQPIQDPHKSFPYRDYAGIPFPEGELRRYKEGWNEGNPFFDTTPRINIVRPGFEGPERPFPEKGEGQKYEDKYLKENPFPDPERTWWQKVKEQVGLAGGGGIAGIQNLKTGGHPDAEWKGQDIVDDSFTSQVIEPEEFDARVLRPYSDREVAAFERSRRGTDPGPVDIKSGDKAHPDYAFQNILADTPYKFPNNVPFELIPKGFSGSLYEDPIAMIEDDTKIVPIDPLIGGYGFDPKEILTGHILGEWKEQTGKPTDERYFAQAPGSMEWTGRGGLSELDIGNLLKQGAIALGTAGVGNLFGLKKGVTTALGSLKHLYPYLNEYFKNEDTEGPELLGMEPWEVIEEGGYQDQMAQGGLISLAHGGNPSVYQAGENIEKLLATKMGYEGNKYSGVPNQQGMINTVNQGIGDNVKSGLRSIIANAYAQGNVPAPSVPQYNQAQLLNKGLTMLPNTANTPVPQQPQPQQPPAQGNISNVYAQSTLPQSHYMQPNQVT